MPRKALGLAALDPPSRRSVSTQTIPSISVVTTSILPSTPTTDAATSPTMDSPGPSSASSDAPSWTTCDEHSSYFTSSSYFSSATSLASSSPSDSPQKQEQQQQEEQQKEQQLVSTATPKPLARIPKPTLWLDPLSRDYPKPEQELRVEEMLSRPPQKWSLAHHLRHARDVKVPVLSPDKRAQAFAEEKERLRRASREMAEISRRP